MFTWKKVFLTGTGLCLLVLLFTTLILPGIISNRASHWVAENTGRTLLIEAITINPFSLSIEVNKLRLSEADQSLPFISWDSLRISLSAASLYHRAVVIDELRLESPYVHLERQAENRFNFSDLLPEQPAAANNGSEQQPTRFSLNNLQINNGQIDLLDNSLEKPVQHRVRKLTLVLPTIGNLPYMVENPAQPLFKAEINDSEINLVGEVTPFSNLQEMHFGLKLDSIDLPFYLGYLPIDLPIEVRNGKLSLDLDLLYRISPETGGEFEVAGKIDLAALKIRDNRQEQLFFLPLLQVEIAPSKPLEKHLHLSAVRIYNLEVQLKRDLQGQWNHARMTQPETEPPAGRQEEEASPPFNLQVDRLEVRDGVLFFRDELVNNDFSTVAREINIDVRDFSLDGSQPSPLELVMETERSEHATIKGAFSLAPLSLVLDADLNNIDVAAYEPYYHDFYSVPLGGKIDVQAKITSNPEQPLLLSHGQLTFSDAYLAFNETEGVKIDEAQIKNLSFDLAGNRLEIDSAVYTNGRINFSRTPEGRWTILSSYFPILTKLSETPEQAAAPEPQVAPESAAKGPNFSYRIGRFAIQNMEIKVSDQLPATPVKLNLSTIDLSLKNLVAPDKADSPFTFTAAFQQKGRIELQGTVSVADQAIRMGATLKQIPLATFSPYIEEELNLILTDGFLNTNLETAVDASAEIPHARFSGHLGINRFHLIDSQHREDLLKWDSLQIAGMAGETSPLELDVESITLSDYFAKVQIDKEGGLNLKEAFTPKTSPAGSGGEELERSAVTESTTTPPAISINTITLQGGHIDFTDNHLPQLFKADMRKLGGRIEGLSSEPDSRALVDLRGQLRNQSPLLINGVINPLAEKLFLDLKLSFNDIELSPLSPYSGNYVGYLIEKGKLNLGLEYYIEEEQLKAQNKVFLDQFSFGDEIESDNAINLPVKLAVALLKDRKGEIHLDIPVSGSLGDPQFSIGGVIWTVLKNLLVKAATSPFALLGAVLGGGDEDFSHINFAYGSSTLDPAAEENLQRVAQALLDRPALKVEVSGFIDPEQDEEGYRREQLARQVKRLKYLDLVKAQEIKQGDAEEDVLVPAAEYDEYLWQVYSHADFPKPRNFVGMTKKLPAAEMEKLIYTNTTVTPDHLAELAQARALAVQSFLIEKGQLEQNRIFLKKPEITADTEQETSSRARVELGINVR